eukprot:symbB.v1.2.013687.t1/scaffold971.1/size148033/15
MQCQGSPVIGMFSLPTDPSLCGASKCEMLPASYVKYIEPVSIDTTDSEMDVLLDSLNGFLFTGGADLDPPAAALRVLHRSRELFKAGDPENQFPVWGTCLGFEWLVAATSPPSLISGFRAENVNLPLHFSLEAVTSRLFGKAPQHIWDALKFENVSFNSHHRGVRPVTSQALSTGFNVQCDQTCLDHVLCQRAFQQKSLWPRFLKSSC